MFRQVIVYAAPGRVPEGQEFEVGVDGYGWAAKADEGCSVSVVLQADILVKHSLLT